MRGSVSLLFILACVFPAAAQNRSSDTLNSLEMDSSPAAAQKLSALYKSIKNRDQRFWLIQTLGARLKDREDESALQILLSVASDAEPNVRGPALRALKGFVSLPEANLRKTWLAHLDAAVMKGIKDPAPIVRNGAADLQRTLRDWRHLGSGSKQRLEEGQENSGRGFGRVLVRSVVWLWLLGMPVIVAGWAWRGLPIFDRANPEGRSAQAAWRVLCRQRLFLACTVMVWLCLVRLLAEHGFEILVRLGGGPFYGLSSGWWRAYLIAGLCCFTPGAILAGTLPSPPGKFRKMSVLYAIIWSVGFGLIVFGILVPLEGLWRLLLRRAPEALGRTIHDRRQSWRQVVLWMLETGSIRAAYLVLAVISIEGHGLGPASARAMELLPVDPAPRARPGLLGIGAFDLRFTLLCAAPATAFFCVWVTRRQPVEWRVPVGVLLIGCILWAWSILAGLLFAITQSLQGIDAAEDLRHAMERTHYGRDQNRSR